jgi:hypothetical protein
MQPVAGRRKTAEMNAAKTIRTFFFIITSFMFGGLICNFLLLREMLT